MNAAHGTRRVAAIIAGPKALQSMKEVRALCRRQKCIKAGEVVS
jgi:hypothetical protein